MNINLLTTESFTRYLTTQIYPFFSITQYTLLAKTHLDSFHQLLLISFLSFTLLYFTLLLLIVPLKGFSFDVKEEFVNRSVSNINSILACFTFAYWVWSDFKSGIKYDTPHVLGFSRSLERDYSIGILVAYLWFDLIRTLFFNIKRNA